MNGTGHQHHGKAEWQHVSGVRQVRHEQHGGIDTLEPKHAVHKRIKCGAARRKEQQQPTTMVFHTQLVVDLQDRHVGRDDVKNERRRLVYKRNT